jgi:hypothetical protein
MTESLIGAGANSILNSLIYALAVKGTDYVYANCHIGYPFNRFCT